MFRKKKAIPKPPRGEGRQGTASTSSWIKYWISDDELRQALNITHPGSIITISWHYGKGCKGWEITQSTKEN